jgi:hypothetical protein
MADLMELDLDCGQRRPLLPTRCVSMPDLMELDLDLGTIAKIAQSHAVSMLDLMEPDLDHMDLFYNAPH